MANYPIADDGSFEALNGAEMVNGGNILLIANTCGSAVRVTITVGTTELDTIVVDGYGCYDYRIPATITTASAVTLTGGTTHRTVAGARSRPDRDTVRNGHVVFNGEGDLT